MKYYGQSKEVCEKILAQFENGTIPAALSQVFVNRTDNIPSASWSWSNRFITAMHGTSDARGFQQWKSAGRSVKKGAKAIYILGPILVKRHDTDEEGNDKSYHVIVGFKSIPVFRMEDTDIFDVDLWDKCKGDPAEENRLAGLPWISVAKSWNLSVTSYNGREAGALGYYSPGTAIALGTQNLSTWAHELVHAADDKLDTLTKRSGQSRDNEVIAELGGATLLKMAGYEHEADLGGCWEYIKSYCGNDKDKCISFAFKMLNRLCLCLNLILETAEKCQESESLNQAA